VGFPNWPSELLICGKPIGHRKFGERFNYGWQQCAEKGRRKGQDNASPPIHFRFLLLCIPAAL